jgi:hypothetical protein
VHLSIVGAKLWPRLVVVALFGLAVLHLWQSLAATGQAPARPAPWSPRTWLSQNRNVILCFALYALFLIALPWLGMLLGGTLFVFATLTAVGRRDARSHLIHALVAVASIGLMWSIFTFTLGVVLPEGVILPR